MCCHFLWTLQTIINHFLCIQMLKKISHTASTLWQGALINDQRVQTWVFQKKTHCASPTAESFLPLHGSDSLNNGTNISHVGALSDPHKTASLRDELRGSNHYPIRWIFQVPNSNQRGPSTKGPEGIREGSGVAAFATSTSSSRSTSSLPSVINWKNVAPSAGRAWLLDSVSKT